MLRRVLNNVLVTRNYSDEGVRLRGLGKVPKLSPVVRGGVLDWKPPPFPPSGTTCDQGSSEQSWDAAVGGITGSRMGDGWTRLVLEGLPGPLQRCQSAQNAAGRWSLELLMFALLPTAGPRLQRLASVGPLRRQGALMLCGSRWADGGSDCSESSS